VASKDGIGSPVRRLDAADKVRGAALFVDDLRVAGPWYGGTVRSPSPRGRILALEWDPAFDRSPICCLTAADLPGPNAVAMIREDHPILAAEQVRFFAEPVALLAAPTPALLEAALAAVRVRVEEEPPVLSIEESLAGGTIIWGQDNVIADYRIVRGSVEEALKRAEVVVEGTYRTGYQEHLYIETNGVIASPLPSGGIEIVGSLQCPYYIHRALCKALALPPEQVVIKQAVTGGAFGGKEDYPSVLSAHAALLALRCGHPVRMILGRTEDIRSTTKRHPSRTHIRTGVTRSGELLAAEIDLVMVAGAYTTLSPVVLSRGLIHSSGPYRIPHAFLRGRAVATNTPPNGAFRGFGVPQSIFALERHLDRVAAVLGLEPLEIRRRNLMVNGDEFPYGQKLHDGVSAGEVLERVVELSGYEEKRRAAASAPPGRARRGIGLSLFHHGAGFTGSGEEKIAGKVKVRFTSEGKLEVLASTVEMGQGAATVLPMIAAGTLGLPLELAFMAQPDTSRVPDSGTTVASRTVMVVGKILVDACRELAEKVRTHLAARLGLDEDLLVFQDGAFARDGQAVAAFLDAARAAVAESGPLEGTAAYEPVPGVGWNDETYSGDAYKAYAWGADVIEVEVDTETMEVHPLRATMAVEIGRAIHPVLAVGQIEGGTLQAIGWGSMEEIKVEKGRFLNDRLATYIIPTALDAPSLVVDVAETPYVRGPFGAKGIGELPADGAAPALAAAISQATGLFPTDLPVTPERLLALQEEAERGTGGGNAGNSGGGTGTDGSEGRP
jgi:CO/xanthine dehydrogenase Mo-binding subunit